MPLFSTVHSPSFDGVMFNFSHLRQRGLADLNGDTKNAQRRNGELPCDGHAPTIRLSTHHFGEVINARAEHLPCCLSQSIIVFRPSLIGKDLLRRRVQSRVDSFFLALQTLLSTRSKSFSC